MLKFRTQNSLRPCFIFWHAKLCILRSSNNNSLHIFGWTSVGDPEDVDMIMFIFFLQRNISISHWRHSLTQKLMIWRRIGFLFLDSWHLYNRPLSFNSVQSFLFPPSHPKSLIRLCRIVHNWKRNYHITFRDEFSFQIKSYVSECWASTLLISSHTPSVFRGVDLELNRM